MHTLVVQVIHHPSGQAAHPYGRIHASSRHTVQPQQNNTPGQKHTTGTVERLVDHLAHRFCKDCAVLASASFLPIQKPTFPLNPHAPPPFPLTPAFPSFGLRRSQACCLHELELETTFCMACASHTSELVSTDPLAITHPSRVGSGCREGGWGEFKQPFPSAASLPHCIQYYEWAASH